MGDDYQSCTAVREQDRRGYRPEVRPQVQDLPDPEHNQDEGGAEPEPLDSVVGALVGVAQLLLPRPQVVHLAHDLGDHLLHTAQVSLDRLELLGGLDRGPVLCVGTDVDIELDVAARVGDVLGCFRLQCQQRATCGYGIGGW